MNWDAFSAVSSALATLAITVSVVYLAIQVRTSTKATHSQTYQFATHALAELAILIGGSKDLSRIFVEGLSDPDSLEKNEYYQFSFLLVSTFRRYENIFYQWQSGTIDEDFWNGHRNNFLWFFFQPGGQRFWAERRESFSDRFREFLDSSDSKELAAQPKRIV